jgi:glycerol-3-phosphate acyltransferase PlsY
MVAYLAFPLAALIGYLAGSIPFGLLLTRAAGLGDIRAIGSGNIGATNVLRTGRKDLALATLLLDSLKAGLVALGFGAFGGPEMGLVAGASAFVGHCYPIWLGFKGGKGVATFAGLLPFVSLPAFYVAAPVWFGIFAPHARFIPCGADRSCPRCTWRVARGRAPAPAAQLVYPLRAGGTVCFRLLDPPGQSWPPAQGH